MGFKKASKTVANEKATISNEDLKVNGSSAILKDVEIMFWSYKKISTNPQYKEKFAVTIKLSKKHVKQMEAAKEAAIMYFCKNEDIDPESVDFSDSIFYNQKTDEYTYTFRSDDDFRENTDLNGEQCDPELKIGKGSIANLAIRASACKIFKSYSVIFYLNAANVTRLEEIKGGQIDLRAALR